MKIFLDNDLAVHDAHAVEEANLYGPDARLYVLQTSYRDPLHDEPTGLGVFAPIPVELSGVVARDPDTSTERTEGGKYTRADTLVFIPRLMIEEKGAEIPKVGDIIELWPNTASVDAARNSAYRRKGFYEIKHVSNDGEVGASRTPVRYKLETIRLTDFSPENRFSS